MTSVGHERSLGTLMAVARTRVAADKKTGASTPPGILALAALVDEKAIVVISDQPRDGPDLVDRLSPAGQAVAQKYLMVDELRERPSSGVREVPASQLLALHQMVHDRDISVADVILIAPGAARYTSTTPRSDKS